MHFVNIRFNDFEIFHSVISLSSHDFDIMSAAGHRSRFPCDLCDKSFTLESRLELHKARHHEVKMKQEPDPVENSNLDKVKQRLKKFKYCEPVRLQKYERGNNGH